MTPSSDSSVIRCGALVRMLDDDMEIVEGPCLRLATDNVHRPDTECDDPDGHAAFAAILLHHPFMFPAQEAHQ